MSRWSRRSDERAAVVRWRCAKLSLRIAAERPRYHGVATIFAVPRGKGDDSSSQGDGVCRSPAIAASIWNGILGSGAEIARAGADQDFAFVLLDRMRDPADGPADNEQSEPCAARQLQPDASCREREIDIGPSPGQAKSGLGSATCQ